MPKRKGLPSIPDYVGCGKNPEKSLIQKSNPLQSLSQTSMTLPELKILDAYLSRINSHEPEKRYVRFEKGELEKLLGVTRMHKEELSRRLKNLFQVVEIHDERKPKGFKCVSLFEEAECQQDENGLWQVNLMCTNSAMEYIFNIENLGYLKYRLKNVINLTSRYSYILYLFLEDNKIRKISLDDLKKKLNCTAERYTEFKFFNAEILKKCQKEINEKTTINFTYTPIKKGRKVVAISFEVEKNSQIEVAPDIAPEPESEMSVPDRQSELLHNNSISESYDCEEDDEYEEEYLDGSEKYTNNKIAFLATGCNYEFSELQMMEIAVIISNMDFIETEYKNSFGIDFSRVDYLMEKYAKLNTYAEGKDWDTKRRFAYFRKIIENDRREHQ
ncbi:MAG: replication initiation protein [Ruminococcus sp.]|nr:replication initiation protein [Ruminococcus sp.]